MNLSPSSIVSFYRSNPRTLHLHLSALVFLVAGILARRFNSGDAGFYCGFVAFCALAGVLHTWAYERRQMPKAPAPSKEKTERPENEERRRTPPMPKGFWQKRAGFTLLILIIGVLCFLLSRKMNFGGLTSWWQFWNLRLSRPGGMENLPAFLAFPMAGLVWKAWRLWGKIPGKEYKLWGYNPDKFIDNPEIVNPVTVRLWISKRLESTDYISKTLKAPSAMVFGDLFQYFLIEYNTKHDADNQIRFAEERYDDQPWGWLFHIKPSGLRWWKIYVDPDLTVKSNQLDKYTVMVNENGQKRHIVQIVAERILKEDAASEAVAGQGNENQEKRTSLIE